MVYYHGYNVVAASFVHRFTGMGILYSLALYLTPLQVSFGIGTGKVATLPAVVRCCLNAAVLLAAYIHDELTRRNISIRSAFVIGGALVGVGTISSSFSNNFSQVVGFSILTGVGIGFTGGGCAGICAQWFVKWRGTALLLGMSGAGIGSFLYVIGTEELLRAFHKGEKPCDLGIDDPSACQEWREALRYAGIFTSSLIIIASWAMRLPDETELREFEMTNTRVSSRISKHLIDIDILAIRLSSIRGSRLPTFDSQPSTTNAGENGADALDSSLSLGQALKTRSFILLNFWAMTNTVAYDAVFTFIPASAQNAGLSKIEGAIALSLTGLAVLIGNFTIGFIGDKIGHLRTLQLTMNISFLSCLAWPFCRSFWSLIMIVVIYGYSTVGWFFVVAIITATFEKMCQERVLTLIGILNALAAPGALLGPVIFGILKEKFSFEAGAFFLSGMLFIGNVALCWVPSPDQQVKLIQDQTVVNHDSSLTLICTSGEEESSLLSN